MMAQLLAVVDPATIKVTRGGCTPLHFAAANGHQEVVTQLLAASPSMATVATFERRLPLHCAAIDGHNQVLKQLLAVTPSLIKAAALDEQTVLHFAAANGHSATVRLLLAHEPPPSAVALDEHGRSILQLAIKGKCDNEVLRRLYELHPAALHCLQKRSAEGPFHAAIRADRHYAIEMLQLRLSFDEIVSALEKCGKANQLCRPVVEQQCEPPLLEWLQPDLVATVFEYLGFGRQNHAPPQELSEWPVIHF